MSDNCSLARAEKLEAYYAFDRLILLAEGMTPTPNYVVHFRMLKSFAPGLFELVWCNDSPFDIDVLKPYRQVETFRIPWQSEVTVITAGGVHTIPVIPVDLPRPRIDGAGDIPSPFLLPLDLRAALPGTENLESRCTEATKVTSTGYSFRLSFDEAYRDALRGLPQDPAPFPDKLVTVRVEEIGSMHGGITGRAKLFVTISALY